MKIGVFGDSFADKTFLNNTWWNYLRDYGHTVSSFGEAGSSLAFSAGLLWTHVSEFDHVIWCVTSVNRVSFQYLDRNYHVTNSFDNVESDDEVARRQRISKDYLTFVHDSHGYEVLGYLAVQAALKKFDNITVIPCFATPVYFMQTPGFNLCELSSREAAHFFPGQDLYSIQKNYHDRRAAHFLASTHRQLAVLIDQAVQKKHQLFSADYNSFSNPKQSENRFVPK
jgi:hypothetical protein